MNNKRGISLIVLVITIIVMIILASAIILALSGNGVIFKTNKAKFQNDMATMKEELSVYISDRELETNGAYNSDNLSATKDSLVEEGATVEEKTILDIIKSMDKKYIDKMEIVNGKLRYTGSNIDEIKWSDEILEGIRGYDLEEENIEVANTLKLSDSINMSLSNYRIYGNSVTQQLPEEYQEVGYIEVTGTQYIDTNFVPSGKLTVKGKINVPTPDREIAIVGTDEHGWELGFSTGSNRMFSYPANIGKSIAVITTTSMWNTELEFTAINDYNNSVRSLSINIENQYTEDTNIDTSYKKNLLLFNYRKHYTFTGKCYNIKIYDDDVLKRDFIPCYRKSDGEVGMYDIVNNTFYTNQGTGKFIKGKDVGSVGDYVVDMDFDNKWKQGHILGNQSLVNNRLTSKNLIKSEIGATYKVTSNLPDDIQLSLGNGTYTTYPYNESDCLYDSGWLDDDLMFTSTINGNIVMTIRHKDNTKITPEDVATYEIKVEKYVDETEEGGQCVIPIKTSGINLFSMAKCNPVNKTVNGITFTTLDDERIHIKGKVEDTSIRTTYNPSMLKTIPIDAGIYKVKSCDSVKKNEITIMFGMKDASGSYALNLNAMHSMVNVPKDGYIGGIHVSIDPNITREFDEIIELQLTKGTINYSYEPYVEPKVYNIYLDEPLRKIGNYVDYIDFRSQEVVRNVEVVESTSGEQTLRGLETPIREKISIPNVILNEGTNIIEVLTKAQPSKIEALYYTK